MMARLLVLALVALFAPAAVYAQPDPANSELPPVIKLVGKVGNSPDAAGLFQVVVRDVNNIPVEGAKVVVEFGACAQLTIGSQQTHPGVTLEQCVPPVVSAFTDPTGTAQFVVMGGVADRGAAEPIGPCGVIRASVGSDPPVLLGSVLVAAFDQDGRNGVDDEDLSLFLSDVGFFLCLEYHQRSDFDGDGCVDPDDLFLMNDVMCARRSDETAPRCDGVPANNSVLRAEDGDLYVAWDDCRGGGGNPMKSFACDTNTGSRTLIASFRAPAGVNSLNGFEAELEVVGDVGVALPDWWRFDPPAGCRRTGALTVSGDFTGGPIGCPDPGGGTSASCVTVVYPTAGGVIHQQRIRVRGSVSNVALTAGDEYSLLKFTVNNSKTTGSGSCGGCGQPVAVVLQSLQLRQSADPDLAINITSGSSGAVAYWQGVPSGFSITDVPSDRSTTDWLAPPAPNPTQGGIAIRFGLTEESRVSLAIYDLAGRRIRVIASGALPAGEHTASWDGRSERGEPLAGGLYFLRLVRGERVLTRPIVRIR